jgi:glycosyltransferase involved in cell wall biosynthesis
VTLNPISAVLGISRGQATTGTRSMIRALPMPQPDLPSSSGRSLPHVLLVVDQFPKTLGGGERIVLRLAALLPAYGFRASILTFFVHPDCTDLKQPPCPIYVLPLHRTWDWTALRAALDLRRFLQREQVRIVQAFFESSHLWAGAVTKTLSDARLVWSMRDMGILRDRKHRIAYRLMKGVPDAVFAVSEQVRRSCIQIDGIAPARVKTIYNGLDLARWEAPPSAPRSGAVVTTVGNIRRVKGHDLLIRSAAQLATRFPSASFSIAGDVLDPDYFAELQALVQQLGLAGRFRFLGGVADARAHLAAADIFVLPSRSEGFSNAIVEAMATSLPVVATDVGGNAEAVKDGVTGLVVPPEDADALAAAIARLLAAPSQARAMGIAGRSYAQEMFTTEAMMEQMAAAYNDLLA